MDDKESGPAPHAPAGASYREVTREEPMGCLGWFCAVLGVTPARMKSKRAMEREANAGEPRVIRGVASERAPDGSDGLPGEGAGR